MRVILKRNWYSPVGRIKKGLGKRDPVEVPAELRPWLPRDAQVVDEDYVAPVEEKSGPTTLSEAAKMLGVAPELAAAEATAAIEAQVDAERKQAQGEKVADAQSGRLSAAAKKFQAELEAEKAALAEHVEPTKISKKD